MCGRITLTRRDLDSIARDLGASFDLDDAARYKPRYNAAPSDLLWLLVGDSGERRIVPAVWGLPSKRAKRPPINIQAETLRRGAFKSRRRSVVIGDGFYEWTGAKGERRPLWFHRRGSELMLFAAVDTPLDASTRAPLACAVITVEPGADVAAVHDRQPALLEADQLDVWFAADDDARLALLAPSPAGTLETQAVSRRVNDVANDDPACLATWAAPAPVQPHERQRPRQLSLLDEE